jgi:hypothetical protein
MSLTKMEQHFEEMVRYHRRTQGRLDSVCQDALRGLRKLADVERICDSFETKRIGERWSETDARLFGKLIRAICKAEEAADKVRLIRDFAPGYIGKLEAELNDLLAFLRQLQSELPPQGDLWKRVDAEIAKVESSKSGNRDATE